jgi:hypothetical protein
MSKGSPITEMIGQKYGMLTALKVTKFDKHGKPVLLFRCDCGKEKEIVGSYVRNGSTRSCGCYHVRQLKEHPIKRRAPINETIFPIWKDMMKTHEPIVCQRWRWYSAFEAWALRHYFGSAELRRKDKNGLFSRENCYFAEP